MAQKKQFYAVAKGRRPGIYLHWTGAGGAEEQVSGFPGAVYRGFANRAEAENYLRSGGKPAPAQPSLPAEEFSASSPTAPRARPPAAQDHLSDLEAGRVVAFTDGASTGNPGPGGYGVVLLYGSRRKELSGGYRCTTNNRMELRAVIAALSTLDTLDGLPLSTPVVLYSDSRYVVDAIVKGWAARWRANQWMRNAENRAENPDLWQRLLDLLKTRKVEFRWVRGHASHPENERCDRLAVQAAHGRDLPEDPGFDQRSDRSCL